MMNLPIKFVDLVTLLFLSLLVVIIIFIILQRNIKRFKLRNVKDPHFLTCKSIPKDIKEAILRKHSLSHAYNEPDTLLTSNYLNSNDETKSFLKRIKVFETSKNLEYALSEYGYRRPISYKFEEFIDTLINSKDETLRKDLLREFYKLYLWAMVDPMKFEIDQLKGVYKLINQIIEQLASNKRNLYDQIIQHKLDLDSSGDYDFSRKNNQPTQSLKNKNKEVKFGSYNLNNNNLNSYDPTACTSKEKDALINKKYEYS